MEDAPERNLACLSGPGLPKEGDEVGVGLTTGGLRVRDGGTELGVGAVVGEGDHKVRNGHLEGDAHSTAEVEAEVELALLGFAVGLSDDRNDGGISLGAQVGFGLLGSSGIECIFGDRTVGQKEFCLVDTLGCGFLLELTGEVVEAERVQGGQCEQHREDQDGTFVLHGSGVFKVRKDR